MAAFLPDMQAALPVPAESDVLGNFGGDQQLYASFRASCVVQFAADVEQGDAAAAAGDVQALRRTAHNLQSVLAVLGETAAAACARELEAQSAAIAAPWAAGWQRLRAMLLDVVAQG